MFLKAVFVKIKSSRVYWYWYWIIKFQSIWAIVSGERTRVVESDFRKSDKSKYFLRHPVRKREQMLQGLPSWSKSCKQISHWHWPCLFDLLNRYAWPDYRKVEYFLPFEKTFLYFMPLIAPKYSLTWLATGSHEMDQFHILNVRKGIHFILIQSKNA